jgi:hypothetical protein
MKGLRTYHFFSTSAFSELSSKKLFLQQERHLTSAPAQTETSELARTFNYLDKGHLLLALNILHNLGKG